MKSKSIAYLITNIIINSDIDLSLILKPRKSETKGQLSSPSHQLLGGVVQL